MDPIAPNPPSTAPAPALPPPPPAIAVSPTAPRDVLNASLPASSPSRQDGAATHAPSPPAFVQTMDSQNLLRLGQAFLQTLERAATVPRNLDTALARVVAAGQTPLHSLQRAEAAATLIEGLFGDPAALSGTLAGSAPATGLAGDIRIRVLEGKSAEARQYLSDEAITAYRYFVTGRSTAEGFIARCKAVDVACAQLPPLRGPDAPREQGRTALAMLGARDLDLRVRDDAQRAATRLFGWWTPLTLQETCNAARARQHNAVTACAPLESLIEALTPESRPSPAAADAGPTRWKGEILDAAQRAREDANGHVLAQGVQALGRHAINGDHADLAAAAQQLFDVAGDHATGLSRHQVERLDEAVTTIFASITPRPAR